MSYRQITYQIVFATKNRKRSIDDTHCRELYKYIWGIIDAKKCKLFRINGVENHIHIVSDLHPTIALADYVKDIKVASSKWMKGSGLFPQFDGWAEKYAAFTYTIKERDALIEYVKNQKKHHKTITFEEEYKALLEEHGVEYDEKYLFV